MKKVVPFAPIVEFPPLPSQLPQEVLNYAYSPEDPPITREIPKFQELAANHIPLRKNSALLTKEAAAEARLAGIPTFGSALGGPLALRPGMDNMQRQFMQFVQAQQSAQQHPKDPIPDMTYFGATSRQQPQVRPQFRQPLEVPSSAAALMQPQGAAIPPATQQTSSALVAAESAPAQATTFKIGSAMSGMEPSAEAAPPSVNEDAEDDPAEAAEQAAFARLKAKQTKGKTGKVLKRPNGKDGATGDGDDDEEGDEVDEDEDEQPKPALKKPAIKDTPSKVTPSLKRPASATNVYDMPPINKKLVSSTTWKNFGSNVYHEAKTVAKNAGQKDPLATARIVYRNAGDQWLAAGGVGPKPSKA